MSTGRHSQKENKNITVITALKRQEVVHPQPVPLEVYKAEVTLPSTSSLRYPLPYLSPHASIWAILRITFILYPAWYFQAKYNTWYIEGTSKIRWVSCYMKEKTIKGRRKKGLRVDQNSPKAENLKGTGGICKGKVFQADRTAATKIPSTQCVPARKNLRYNLIQMTQRCCIFLIKRHTEELPWCAHFTKRQPSLPALPEHTASRLGA